MARWLGLLKDTNSSTGGTNEDALTGAALTAYQGSPNIWVPASTAQANKGLQPGDRNNEVRGNRGQVSPIARRAEPELTFSSHAYLTLLRAIVPAWFSSDPTNTGTGPASINSKFSPTPVLVPRALFATLLREGQTDRMSGLAVNTLNFDFGLDNEATVEANLLALYHEIVATSSPPTPSWTGYDESTLLHGLQVKAYDTGGVVAIPCVAGFTLSLDNNLSTDVVTRFCGGTNFVQRTDGGVRRQISYPNQNKLRKRQVSGRIEFADVLPSRETAEIFSVPDKIVIEASAGPLGTTPPADGLMRITLYNAVWTGGGAEPLTDDSDQRSGFDFAGGLDSTNKDIEIEFVGAAAVANP